MFTFTRIFLLSVLVALKCLAGSEIQEGSSKYPYKLFEDGFNTDKLNLTRWRPGQCGGGDNATLCQRTVDETDSKNGSLHLRADKKEFKKKNYTCSQVRSMDRISFLYGEVECRAHFPKGKGLWSSISLLLSTADVTTKDDTKRYEFLIITMLGVHGDRVEETKVGIYKRNYSVLTGEDISDFDNKLVSESEPLSDKNNIPIEKWIPQQRDMSLDFHVYKMIRSPNGFALFINDKEVLNMTKDVLPGPLQVTVFAELAVGKVLAFSPDSNTKFPADFMIDYVIIKTDTEFEGGKSIAEQTLSPITVSLMSIVAIVIVAIIIVVLLYRFRIWKRRKQLPLNMDPGTRLDSISLELSPYLRFLEIPTGRLELTAELLGKGQFGCVYKGLLKNESQSHDCTSPVVVAVKTLFDHKDSHTELHHELFVEEMIIMSKVGRHLNIVNLLGTVTVRTPLMMVLEFCSHGSLLKYLREKRKSFVNCVDEDGLVIGKCNDTMNLSVTETDYLNGNYISMPSDSPLSTEHLIHISFQIARSLEYLASRSIIHRDMAARNVLVSENNVVKISDFGLARERISCDYTLLNNQALLPIKWMAPESLLEKSFSHKSDIWSFGILLWEIFSLGEVPFTSIDGQAFEGRLVDFVQAVSARGLRMKRPVYAAASIYDIMLWCWNVDKDSRPTAAALRAELFCHLEKGSEDYYAHLDEPYEEFNLICVDPL